MNFVASVKKQWVVGCTALMLVAFADSVNAGGEHGGGHGRESHGQHHMGSAAAIGQPGKAQAVDRTIKLTMTDNVYSLKQITVQRGETIRFVIRNRGDLVHEFSIGTPEMHKAHQKEMAAMFEKGHPMSQVTANGHEHDSSMGHDDPNSLLLAPNKTGEVIWKFNRRARLEFACNVPGHYEAGMRGKIHWRASPDHAH